MSEPLRALIVGCLISGALAVILLESFALALIDERRKKRVE